VSSTGFRPAEIRARYPGDQYVAFHATRYAYLLDLVESLLDPNTKAILDIGPSWFSRLAQERFGVTVDTLGLDPDGASRTGHNYKFNLNDAQHPERWRKDIPTYRLVIMAEVIEHLYTAPRLVLGFVTTLLSPGGTLILQTPNAIALHKRLRMLVGRHPYEMIREDDRNPGHHREYTASEIRHAAETAGLRVTAYKAASYFDYRFTARGTSRLGALANLVYPRVPSSMRPAHTFLLTRPADGPARSRC
jgi:trans-aconitate methyltransferase